MKRIVLLVSIFLITISCYAFMNRNYDPLARYPYANNENRKQILKYMDEREIKYIIDYTISPDEFMKYISSYGFSAYHINDYNFAYKYLTNMTPDQIVVIVERLIKKNIDINEIMPILQYKLFEDALYIIDRGL